jgi:transcription elongation factor GreA
MIMSKIQYLSQEGYDKLDQELRDLKTRGRREIAEDIAEARAKGDLSENAEYDAAKEAQGHLETRITQLEDILANARILDAKDLDLTKVRVLTTVTILNIKMKKTMKYTLVSPNEADFSKGKISVDSPIGAALLGKEVGDVVTVQVPAGTLELEIQKIEVE